MLKLLLDIPDPSFEGSLDMVGDSGSTHWIILVMLVALGLCIYAAVLYRRHHAKTK